MNTRQTKLALQMTTAVLAVAALAAVGTGLFLPLETADTLVQTATPAAAKSHALRLPPVDSFSPVFARSLLPATGTASNAVPGPAEPTPAESTAVIAQLVLVGTIGDSIALIKGPDGTVQLVETGDDVMGAAVLAIRPSECDLRLNGKIKTLRIAPTPDDHTITPMNTAAK